MKISKIFTPHLIHNCSSPDKRSNMHLIEALPNIVGLIVFCLLLMTIPRIAVIGISAYIIFTMFGAIVLAVTIAIICCIGIYDNYIKS